MGGGLLEHFDISSVSLPFRTDIPRIYSFSAGGGVARSYGQFMTFQRLSAPMLSMPMHYLITESEHLMYRTSFWSYNFLGIQQRLDNISLSRFETLFALGSIHLFTTAPRSALCRPVLKRPSLYIKTHAQVHQSSFITGVGGRLSSEICRLTEHQLRAVSSLPWRILSLSQSFAQPLGPDVDVSNATSSFTGC